MKKMKKIKKSQMHIEMIMSFIIFTGFIFAILYFINPINEERTSVLNINLVQEKILNNLSITYKSIPLILNEGISVDNKPCIAVDNVPVFTDKIIAVDLSGDLRDSILADNKIRLQYLAGNRVYNLYSSNKFNDYALLNSDCKELLESDYSFGVLSIEKNVLYENLQSFSELYNTDYSSLKKDLKISDNFDFVVYNFSKSVLFEGVSKTDLKSSDVLAREIVLKTIDKDLNRKDIILNLRVW